MNTFRTEVPVEKFPFDIDYKTKSLFLGSCFSDNISQKLVASGFSTYANPFGVLYNPISIKSGLEILLEEKEFTAEDLLQHHGLYHSFFHHGSFSRVSEEETLVAINKSTEKHSKALKNTDILFITFGTAYVYRYKENKCIVSNCHKLPAKEFEHFALSVHDIVQEYQDLLAKIKTTNPDLKIVFTVSPIRHWKDGAHENQLSKSILHLAINELQKQFDFVHYYSSYELVMDDLRDYRFYTEDMVHLNSQAVDYIYRHFQDSFYSKETKGIEKRVLKLRQALSHRPFNAETKEHQEFLKKTHEKVKQLKQEFPEINI